MTRTKTIEEQFITDFLIEDAIALKAKTAARKDPDYDQKLIRTCSRLLDMGNGYYVRVHAVVNKTPQELQKMRFHYAEPIKPDYTPFLIQPYVKDEEGKLRRYMTSMYISKCMTFHFLQQALHELSNTRIDQCREIPLVADAMSVNPLSYKYEVLPLIDPTLAPKAPKGMMAYPLKTKRYYDSCFPSSLPY